jgi:KUP system potassium uptake protein
MGQQTARIDPSGAPYADMGHFGKGPIIPDLRRALRDARGLDAAVDFDKAIFVGTRDLIVRKRKSSSMRRWRLTLFAFLYRNAVKVVDRFNLAPENVIEIARQIAI